MTTIATRRRRQQMKVEAVQLCATGGGQEKELWKREKEARERKRAPH